VFDVDITYSPRLSPAEQQLAALPSRLRNLRPLVEQGIAPLATAMLEQHWASQGAAFGHPWAAWAPSTLAARIRKGNVAQGILNDTGHLFRALFESLANGQRIQATPGGYRLNLGSSGISDPVEAMTFRFHMLGTSKMPARQPVPNPLPRSFRDACRAVVHDYVATGRIRGAGGQVVSFAGVGQ
jgi:hypothetical protein